MVSLLSSLSLYGAAQIGMVVALPAVGVPFPAEEIAPPFPHAFSQHAANCAVPIGGGSPRAGLRAQGSRSHRKRHVLEAEGCLFPYKPCTIACS
jgi:hypothetical protein